MHIKNYIIFILVNSFCYQGAIAMKRSSAYINLQSAGAMQYQIAVPAQQKLSQENVILNRPDAAALQQILLNQALKHQKHVEEFEKKFEQEFNFFGPSQEEVTSTQLSTHHTKPIKAPSNNVNKDTATQANKPYEAPQASSTLPATTKPVNTQTINLYDDIDPEIENLANQFFQ
jgi:hypothetical protein